MAGHGVPFFFTQCKSLVPSPVYAIQVNSGGFFANFLTSLTDDVTSEIAADTVMSNNATVCDLYHPNRIITWLSLVPFYRLKNFISHVNFKLRHSVQIFTVCVNGLIYFTQEIHNFLLFSRNPFKWWIFKKTWVSRNSKRDSCIWRLTSCVSKLHSFKFWLSSRDCQLTFERYWNTPQSGTQCMKLLEG